MLLSFQEKLEARVKAIDSFLCVGLDPHEAELFPQAHKANNNSNKPANTTTTPSSTDTGRRSTSIHSQQDRCDAAFTFCKTLVDATLPYAACYKPNAAFFEALGDGGAKVLRRVCQDLIPPDIPIILDVKRGDIGTTAAAYAVACYDHIGADAVTLSPLMGWDSIEPFVTNKYADKGAFLLCKTSNPTSEEFLACRCLASPSSSSLMNHGGGSETLYERIAKLVGDTWAGQISSSNNKSSATSSSSSSALLGLVVGATDPLALHKARQAAGPNVWILAPGVGFQGGNLVEACRAGLNSSGSKMLIPVSRGISRAENPASAAETLVQAIRDVVQQVKTTATGTETPTNREEIDEEKVATTTSSPISIEPYQAEFIQFSLSQGVLKFGSFVLKSGRTSPYFFNAGLFASGAALFHLGNAYASAIMASPQL